MAYVLPVYPVPRRYVILRYTVDNIDKCQTHLFSVARALGVQSREMWQVIPRLLSDQLEIAFRPARANQAHATPQKVIVFHVFTSPAVFEVPQQLSKARQPLYNSRASRFSLSDSHVWCFCVWVRERACVCVCVVVGSYSSRNQEHNFKNRGGAVQLFLLFFILATRMLPAAAAAAAVCHHGVVFIHSLQVTIKTNLLAELKHQAPN